MSNPHWDTAPPATPVKSGSKHPVALYIVIAIAVVALCGIGVVVAAVANMGDDKGTALKAPAAGPTPNVKAPAPAPTNAARSTLKPSDVELTVKVTDKDCFGSAGCNVQWEVKAAVPNGKDNKLIAPGDTCSVTYRIRGLTDSSTGTLTINDDGTYNADPWNIGQTKKSSSKVTAEVTEVECGR